MTDMLSVRGLCKSYPGFALKDVHFDLREGAIMGFIGRNGAGKTTTLKCLLNFVHPDAGDVRFFGQRFEDAELEIKQRIGFVSGGVSYYPKKKIRTITDVSRRFYADWDAAAYARYMKMFALNEQKTPSQLSEGMKVKYALTLALSHHAKLLILDEPTSGLDPVSRDDLLDVFLRLSERDGVSILFSTHITSDLDKCADDIAYIRSGEISYTGALQTFREQYRAVRLTSEQADNAALRGKLVGLKREKTGSAALVLAKDAPTLGLPTTEADLDTIMVHLEHEGREMDA